MGAPTLVQLGLARALEEGGHAEEAVEVQGHDEVRARTFPLLGCKPPLGPVESLVEAGKRSHWLRKMAVRLWSADTHPFRVSVQ